jgi:hypothetical protein
MSRIALTLVSLLLALSAGCKSKPAAPEVDKSIPAAFRAGAPARYLVPEAKVGWAVKVSHETTSGETTTKSWTHLAVVAETEETLTLELELSAHEGYVEALEVSKKDGKVKRAALAKLEGKSKKLKVMTKDPGALSEGEVETLKVKAGEFKVKKLTGQGVTLWAASEGKVAGATVKEESPTKRELVRVGSKEPLEISGRRLDPRVLTYDDESRVWWSEDAVVKALNGGRVRTQRKDFKSSVVSISTKAKARVEWPGAASKDEKKDEKKADPQKSDEKG